MQEIDLAALTAQVLWAAFALALVLGAVAQRTHFCTMGAVSDIVNMGDWARMRMWMLAIGVAIVGFNLMVGAGWIEAGNTYYTQPKLPWLSIVLGGLMFGIGMVIASGCGNKALVRIGAGNLKSLVVMLVLGYSALVAMRGFIGVWRQRWIEPVAFTFSSNQDLPTLLAPALGMGTPQAALVLGLVLGGALIIWALAREEGRSVNNLLGGVGVGLCGVALWWVSGVLGHLAEHPETLEETFLATNSRRMESFTFVGPVGYLLDWMSYYSDTSKVLTIGIVTVLGVIVGAGLVALLMRDFHWEGFRTTDDLVHHLLGAVLMGVGGVMALGCTIGQGLSGIATLSVGSILATAALIAGCWIGLRYQSWRIERMV